MRERAYFGGSCKILLSSCNFCKPRPNARSVLRFEHRGAHRSSRWPLSGAAELMRVSPRSRRAPPRRRRPATQVLTPGTRASRTRFLSLPPSTPNCTSRLAWLIFPDSSRASPALTEEPLLLNYLKGLLEGALPLDLVSPSASWPWRRLLRCTLAMLLPCGRGVKPQALSNTSETLPLRPGPDLTPLSPPTGCPAHRRPPPHCPLCQSPVAL